MSSTFWFLLEYTVLLALAAGVFGWLGWMWRGSERGDRVKKLQDEVEEQRRLARAAMDERDTARAEAASSAGSVHVSEAAPLIQANEALENENVRLREDRKNLESRLATLQADNASLFSQSAANLAEALKKQQQLETDLALAQAFASEVATLRQQLAEAQKAREESKTLQTSREAEIASLRQKLAEAASEAPKAFEKPVEAPIAKPIVEAPAASPAPKPRVTKKKTPTASAHNAQEKLAQIETALAPQLAVLAALTQERDDWQRRVTHLESKTPPDLAGLGLARRSLGSSAERLSEAQTAVESLQNQQRALHKTLQQTADLASQPDDDLTKIKGIKGVLSDQLHALGIRTWRQIAEWNDDDLRAFSELLTFKNRATRDHWQEQARQLMPS